MILEINQLTKSFEGLVAVNRVSFGIKTKTIKALIGPNGAGKTTIFNIVTGLITPTSGTIVFEGRKIDAYPPHIRAKLGLSRTFQIVRPFAEMNVLENVMVGCHLQTETGLLAAAFRLPICRLDERKAQEKAMQEVEFVGLNARTNQLAGSLSMGEQRLMEIARALASNPKLILLDEPAAGLNERETDQLAEHLVKIRNRGITILLVEHDMRIVMKVSDEIAVISFGTMVAEGTPSEIRNNSEVIAAYLGK